MTRSGTVVSVLDPELGTLLRLCLYSPVPPRNVALRVWPEATLYHKEYLEVLSRAGASSLNKDLILMVVLTAVVLSLAPAPASAGRFMTTLSWPSGFSMDLLVINKDYCAAGSWLEIYFIFTLRSTGEVVAASQMRMDVWLLTQFWYRLTLTKTAPLFGPDNTMRMKAQFHITSEDICNAEWNTFEGKFYFNFTMTTFIQGGKLTTLESGVFEGGTLSMSTLWFIDYWPFPPILLTTTAFWGGYFVVRKLNMRYQRAAEVPQQSTSAAPHEGTTD